jgi:uncharacterized protein (TIRG00374 family)
MQPPNIADRPGPVLLWFRRVLLLAGAIAAAVMLWNLDVHAVGRAIAHVGWGLPFLLVLEIIPELLHTTGWRFAFDRETSRSYSTGELLKLWVTGEGVNYLVPSATIAGEVTRVAMLNDSHPADVRATSVVVARIAGTLGQVAYLLAGFAIVLPRLSAMQEHLWIGRTAAILLFILVIAVAVYALAGWRWIDKAAASAESRTARSKWLQAVPDHLRAYFGSHPGRFVASMIAFALAYAWGAVEAFFICRFIGVPVSIATAFSIEVLSVAIDGVLFLVPAKMGTQELGKTAIFSLLGLPLSAGFAFGVVRHIRELSWAISGFAIYTTAGRASAQPS